MATTTVNTTRTAHLLALMKNGDDAFNGRDFAAVDAVHHPNMLAHITGNAQPIYGSAAHAAAMRQMWRIFPDITCTPRTPPSLEAATGSPWSPAAPERSPERCPSPTAK